MASIKQIRNEIDYINVVWQRISWFGNPCNKNLESFLNSLLDDGYIDELIEFKPKLGLIAHKNERNKRNIGLNYAKKAGVDYFMTSDCDEFYKEADIKQIKKQILIKRPSHTFVLILNYFYETKYCKINDLFRVASFFKVNRKTKLVKNKHNKLYKPLNFSFDDTRTANVTSKRNFLLLGNVCHHFSNIRNDLLFKYNNSALYGGKAEVKEISEIDLFYKNLNKKIANNGIAVTGNYFDINIENKN